MSVRAFCGVIDPQGYTGTPVDGFGVNVSIKLFNSDGPGSDELGLSMSMPLGSTEMDMCEMMYQEILARCTTLGWSAPTRNEVFCSRSLPIAQDLSMA